MTRHAFQQNPAQLDFIANAIPAIAPLRIRGVSEAWDMPVSHLASPEGFDVRYPDSRHVTISYVAAGAPVERMDGRYKGQRAEPKRDVFMLYPGHGERRWRAEGAIELRHFYMTLSMIAAVAGEVARRGDQDFELRDDRIVARDATLRLLLDQYAAHAADENIPPSTLEMDARAVLVAAHLVRYHSNRTQPRNSLSGNLSALQLKTAIDYLEAHLDRNPRLADIAAAVGLSPHYFCTAFARSTGRAPHQFLMARRIDRAKQLLLEDQPLVEVALDCGFSSQSHFTTVFRKIAGATPAAWRAAHRR